MKHAIIGLGTLLALGAGPALAQDTAARSAGNWYIGANAGWADPSDTDFDDSTAYKLFGGYRFTRQIGAEFGYTNLGEFEDGGELDVDGYQASVVGTFPFADRLSLLGRAGLYMWDAESNIAGIGDDDGVDGVIGFGAEYGLGNQFALRAEWEWFSDVGETEVNVYSAGLTVDF